MAFFKCAPWESNTTAENLCEALIKKDSRKRERLSKEKIKQNKTILKQAIEKELDKIETIINHKIKNTAQKDKKKSKKHKSKNKHSSSNTIDNFVENKKQKNESKPDIHKNKLKHKNERHANINDKAQLLQRSIAEVSVSLKLKKQKKKDKLKNDKLREMVNKLSSDESTSKIINKKTHRKRRKDTNNGVSSPRIITETIIPKEISEIIKKGKRNSVSHGDTNQQSPTKHEEKNVSLEITYSNRNNVEKTKIKVQNEQVQHKTDKARYDEITKLPLKLKKKMKHLEKLKNSLTAKQLTEKSEPKNMPILTLRQKMMRKLKAARFRYLNEQIYKTSSKEAVRIFKMDPDAFQAYHEGYRLQVKRWPFNPLDRIVKTIKNMPKTHIIADFGCGDAKLAQSVDQKVHSFDLVATSELVTACDMAHVPLEDSSVDVVVFCLSLMGTNLHDYLLEANRVLKVGGLLKIAEVESRFENVEEFIENVTRFGFKKIWKDLSNNLFYFMDFKKEQSIKNRNKLPMLSLLPCLYKKR